MSGAVIERLDHRRAEVAQQIHGVLMLAYAQEAALLRVQPGAPFDRTPATIQAEPDLYLGALDQGVLLGALSFGPDDEPGQFVVNALVVHPAHQRRGVARALLGEALRLGGGHAFAVATAAANAPALALYRGLGFVPYRAGCVGPQALALLKLRRAGTL